MTREELHDFIANEKTNICQIACYRDGKQVYIDEWNDYKRTDTCHVMSVTKSIVCLLIGIALDKGYIKSIDQHVLDFFPDYKIKRGEKTIQDITIRHLMTMQAPYKYKSEPWTRICTTDDWTIAALDFLGGRKGVTGEFKYSTLGIHILTGIITKTSGLKTVDFANKYLFEPLGIPVHSTYIAKTAEEHKHFTISKEPKTKIWFSDPKDVCTAGYGLCLSALDMMKIGILCLNDGFFEGKSIVSSNWISDFTKPTCKLGEQFGNLTYGSLWWIIDKEKNIYAAIGDSGNIIYVNPCKRIVIGITSYFKPMVFDRIDLIRKSIEPLISGEI